MKAITMNPYIYQSILVACGCVLIGLAYVNWYRQNRFEASGSSVGLWVDIRNIQPGTPPVKVQLLEPGTAAILMMEFHNTSVAEWGEWYNKEKKPHKAEVIIDFDGRRVSMTLADFERRLFAGSGVLPPPPRMTPAP